MTTRALPVHTVVEPFDVEDNQLMIGGASVETLAARAGQTPFYAYDAALIRRRVEHLRATLPEAIDLHYAIKANPMPAVVALVGGMVDGLDIASAREMRVALDTGMDPRKMSFAGPDKSTEELREGIAGGITITIESEGELERAIEAGETLGIRPYIAVRVNPDFELKTSGMKMAGGPKPFGIDAERVPDVLQRIEKAPVNFAGFHIFCGSQNLRHESIVEAQKQSYELARSLAEPLSSPPEFVNLGGGFGIPYFPGDKPLDLAPIADNLAEICDRMAVDMPGTKPVVELGRYIVGEAGVYVCRVVDRKVSRGRTYLVTNGGLHHHLAASGNFGQIIRKNYPVVVASRVFDDALENQTVVGPLCTPLDLLADRMELPRADVGDLIAILQSGAYGLTASPTQFLSHPVAVEMLC